MNRDTPKGHSSPITQLDVARALGVAESTISRALRNSPRIPEVRRKLIQAKAREMGYHLNPMAVALSHCRSGRKSGAVGAAIAWLNFWEKPEELRRYKQFDLYWRGASACAERFGYRIEEFVVNDQMPLRRIEQILVARGVTGILIPPGPFPDDPEQMNWERFAVVRLGWALEALPVHTITSDQMANTMLAFQKVRALGYERIGFVGYRSKAWLFGAGYLWAQIDLPERLRLPPLLLTQDRERTYQSKLSAWLKKMKPDAILSEYHNVQKLLEVAGYRVPGDIGLVALNVRDHTADAGIDQNPEEIGRVALLTLISLINDNDRGLPPTLRHIHVAGTWIDGSSLPIRTGMPGRLR